MGGNHYGPDFYYYTLEDSQTPLTVRYIKRQLKDAAIKTRWEVLVVDGGFIESDLSMKDFMIE